MTSDNVVDFHKCTFECQDPEHIKQQRDNLVVIVQKMAETNNELFNELSNALHYRVRKIV